jgi:transposase
MESGDDIASLKAALAAMTARAIAAEADAAYVKARLTSTNVQIESLKLEIARLRRETYGQTSERGARLIEQLEFQLEELETDRAEDEAAADAAALKAGRTEIERRRRHPVKKPFPAHLPRERVIVPAPTHCACCGSSRLAKLGEFC